MVNALCTILKVSNALLKANLKHIHLLQLVVVESSALANDMNRYAIQNAILGPFSRFARGRGHKHFSREGDDSEQEM